MPAGEKVTNPRDRFRAGAQAGTFHPEWVALCPLEPAKSGSMRQGDSSPGRIFLMDPQHVVLVIGGGISGAEAAFQFARWRIRCVVIDQNERPYGKIEDGLPRWHVNLRSRR